MRKLIVFVIVGVISNLISSCSNTKSKISNEFVLMGEFINDYSDSIYVEYGGFKDSAVVVNNTFHFKGKLNPKSNDDREAFLSLKDNAGYGVVFLDTGVVNVKLERRISKFEGNTFNWIKVINVDGSTNHAIWDTLVNFRNKHHKEKGFRKRLLDKLKSVSDTDASSPIVGRYFYLNANEQVFNKEDVFQFKNSIDTTAMFSGDLEKLNEMLRVASRLEIGKPLKTFKLESVNGEFEKFYSNSTVEFTLIDFWASWCGPCRIRNQQLKRVHNKYQDTFNVIGVSIDDEKNEWINAINEDGLQWKNYIVKNDWDASICKYYGINAIPFNILVNAEGQILKVNLSEEELEKIISNTNID